MRQHRFSRPRAIAVRNSARSAACYGTWSGSPISDPDILIARMGKVLRYYKNLENCPATFQRRVSTVCVNYLYTALCIRKIDKYVSETMALIRTLPFDDRFGLKILITQYFEDMKKGDKKSMQQLKDVLRHAGLTKLANRL